MFKMACKSSSSVVINNKQPKTDTISGAIEPGKRGSELEAMEEEEGEVGKPVRKKRLIRVLRAKKRGARHCLNNTRLHGHCINSSLNSTLLKQTLRTNNRALAKALEMKRQDLNVAQQLIIQLQEEQQHVLQQLNNLQHIAGLKDSAIETEVQLRIQSRMDDTKKVLSKVCMQLLSTVDLIHGALDISSCRASSVSRPNTPLGDASLPTQKNVFYNGPRASTEPDSCPEPEVDIVAASAALDRSLGEVELAASAVTGHPDLSIILEQSMLIDSVPMLFTEDDQLDGQQCASRSRSHSRHRKDGTRRAGPVYPPACITLTPPPAQPSGDKIVTNECQSRRSSAEVSVDKSQRETTNLTSSTSDFDGMSMEQAFGRRDAGHFRAEDRPLPTLVKKQQLDDTGSEGVTQDRVIEVSSDCTKKRSKLKRYSRVKVSSHSHQEACDTDAVAVTAASETVVTDSGDSCNRRDTFVVTPGSETLDVVGQQDDKEPREEEEVEEKEGGILEEEFDNILVTDVEDDILLASPVTEAGAECVRDVAPEQTVYSDEDMEMTGVLNIPMELDDNKMSMPDYINRESAHEPSFLVDAKSDEQDTPAIDPVKQDVTKETKTRKLATKKASKKTDNPSKHKLTLKNGKSKASRKSRLKKSARTVDSGVSDDDSKAASDTETKKFSTYITKPGQMSFTTGTLDQMAPPKGASMLPRVTARSKPRAKTNKTADIPVKDAKSTTDEPKSVFDMSMNESVIMVRTKYSDFREHCTAISSKDSSSDDASSDVNIVGEGSHGIMLTLGNGKRTKPRRARSKQVSYASVTVNTAAPVSDVTKPVSSVTVETLQGTECGDVDSTSMSGDDNVFVSSGSNGDDASVTAAGRAKRQRKCRSSVVYTIDTPDTSLSAVDDTTHVTEGGDDKETLSCLSRRAGVCSLNPDEETSAATVEGTDIVTDDGVSDMDNFCVPDKEGGEREDAGVEPSGEEACGEETDQDQETVSKPTSGRESKVRQKQDASKVKQTQVKSRVKEYESKMKENKLKVKPKESKLKNKQKDPNLKEKCSKSKVKQKEVELKKKEDESKVEQKEVESKEKESNVGQKEVEEKEDESNVVQKEVESKEKEDESNVVQKEVESKEKEDESNVVQKEVESKEKEDESNVVQKDVKSKDDEPKLKQNAVESKEDVSDVKRKGTASKMKQKEPESKVNQKAVTNKVKVVESKVKQKESKRTDPQVRQTHTGQRPKVKETPTTKSGGGLSREKRRSGRSIIVVDDASYRQSDKECDASGRVLSGTSETNIMSELCKKQKVKKQSIHTGKLSVVNRKRSADVGGVTVSHQIATPQNPAVVSKPRPSGTRESVVSRVSITLPDVSPCKRRRRAASNVNYKEPSLSQKMRQGDPHTVSVYVGKDGEVVVPPTSTIRKKKTELRLSRRPLDTITNGDRTSLVSRASDITCV